MEKAKKYWKIQGWDSFNLLFEYKVKLGLISTNRMKELLRTLTAKIALNEQEIINSYVKKGTKTHFDHLAVEFMEGKKFMLSCGSGPHVIAVVEEE